VRGLENVVVRNLIASWIPELIGELVLALELDDSAVLGSEPIGGADDLGKLEMLDDLRIGNEDFSRSLVAVESRDHGLEEMTELEQKLLVIGRRGRMDLRSPDVNGGPPGIETQDGRIVGSAESEPASF
jgi:hypothetical protein